MSWKPDPHCQCNDENEVQCPRKGNRLWIVRHGQDKRYIPVCEFHYEMLSGRRAEESCCVCHVGAQPCPVHPGNTKTQEEKIAFRKDWDERVRNG